MNYLSNGFHITYQLPSQSRWTVGVGLRIMVNTYSLNINDENRVYYQNGYASNIWEHFGLTGRVRFRIFEYRNIGLDAAGSVLLTWHGLKVDYNNVYDITTGQYTDDVVYTKPALALEAIVGPNLYCNITRRLRANVSSGLGVILMSYSQHKQSLVTGKPVREYRATNYQGRFDIG